MTIRQKGAIIKGLKGIVEDKKYESTVWESQWEETVSREKRGQLVG